MTIEDRYRGMIEAERFRRRVKVERFRRLTGRRPRAVFILGAMLAGLLVHELKAARREAPRVQGRKVITADALMAA